MLNLKNGLPLGAVAGGICLLASVAAAAHEEFLSRLPVDANALIVIDVDKLLNSPYAVREGWRQQHAADYAERSMLVPPQARAMMMAAELDTMHLTPIWQVAVIKMKQEPSMAMIARGEGGKLETLAGAEAVWTPMDAYFIKLRSDIMGIMLPADRQLAGRWIEYGKKKRDVTVSPYLQKAATYLTSAGTEVIMALDLQHIVSEDDVREELKYSKVFGGKPVNLAPMIPVLASLQGVTLGVRIGDKPYGAIKIDFGQDASVLADYAKPLLMEVLADVGATIDEIQNWKTVVAGPRITIQGPLAESGLTRIFSVLELPVPLSAEQTAPTPVTADGGTSDPPSEPADDTDYKPQQPDKSAVAAASQKYFRSVTTLLSDLRYRKGAASIGEIGLWLENYARRIDRLPILHVDAELVDYGAFVGEQLRQSSMSVKGVGINTAERKSKIHSYELGRGRELKGTFQYSRWSRWRGGRSVGGRVYGYAVQGYRGRRIQAGERRRVAQEEKAKGARSAIDIMNSIENATAEVRRTMTERYQVEFR